MFSHDFVNPNPPRQALPPLPRRFNLNLNDVSALQAARKRHSDEVFARLRWCLDNGHFPAHNHVHLAPGDDDNFMVRTPC